MPSFSRSSPGSRKDLQLGVLIKRTLKILKKRGFSILFRKDGLTTQCIEIPVYIEIRIIPANTTFRLGMVEIGALVGKDGIGNQGEKAMRESRRDVKLGFVLFGKIQGVKLPVSGRAASDINGYVPYSPFDDPYQFTLGVRGRLEVQPAQNALLGQGLVVLHKMAGQSLLFKAALIVCFEKIAPIIAKYPGLNDLEAFYACLLYSHRGKGR